MPDSDRSPAMDATPPQIKRNESALADEWPTWLLLVAIYGGWGALTWFYEDLPWWLVLPAGAWLVAWQNSFQHEALHGHPTRIGWLNDALAWPALGLWIPYAIYRDSHRAHHETPVLTDPLDDPESYYVTESQWCRLSPVSRALLWVNNTLAGRLVIGPWMVAGRFWCAEAARLLSGGHQHLRAWLIHSILCAALLVWTALVCGISPLEYILLFAWPGLSLTLMRSYHEHRPAGDQAARTTILESGPLLSLLYLNNNLHLVHHDHPSLPWWRIPAHYRRHRADILRRNGGFLIAGGYLEVARRYGLHPKDSPAHPG